MVTIAQRFALAIVALLAIAPPAGAATVARTDGARLDASDDTRAGFCLRIQETGSAFGGGSTGTCGRAPWRQGRSNLITQVSGRELVVAGAVPASVTRAEAELADGRRVAFDTVAGPRYRGRYAGRLRFFLAAVRAADPEDFETGGLVAVRFFGADGTLQGIAGADYEGTRVGSRRVLLRERARRRSTTVAAETQRRVAPAPGTLDRFEDLTCLVVRSREGGSGGGGSTVCHEPGPNRPALTVFPSPGCDGQRTILSGFVGDAVTAVRLTLGSGRVREVRTRTLLDRQGGVHRYLATAVPRGEALRSVSAVGAEAEYETGEPPSGIACLPDTGLYAIASYLFTSDLNGAARPPAGDEQVAVEAEGHRLLVRDAEADRLCAGLDRLLADGSDCALPAVHGEDAVGTARAGLVTAVLPAEVARVRLPDGREVPTVEGAYSGRYAGKLRFLLARSGAEGRFRLLDSAGAVIGTLPVFGPDLFDEEPVAGPVKLAAGRGWTLSAERHRSGSCTFLEVDGEEEFCFGGLPGTEEVYAAVGCSPRVAVVTGPLPRGTRAVRAVLRGGRTVRARVVRIPRRFGGGRAWVLALPRAARVKALRLDGIRMRFPLLPAAKQCGYRVYAPGLFGGAEPELELRSP